LGSPSPLLLTRTLAEVTLEQLERERAAIQGDHGLENGAIHQRASIVEDSRGRHRAEMMKFPALVSEPAKFVAPPAVKVPRSSRPR
jgi:hypothetical protein